MSDFVDGAVWLIAAVAKGIGLMIIATIYIVGLAVCASVIAHPFL